MQIIVNMACGLANRMFQYTYYLYLKKCGYDVKIDYYHTAALAHESVKWEKVFPKAPIVQSSAWRVFVLGGGCSMFSKVRRRYFPKTCNVHYMPTAFSAETPEKDGIDKYIFGVFQNAHVADCVKDEVLQKFTFTPFTDEYNIALQKEIQACNSVGIHIRKGKDYMSRIWYQDTCPLEYYRKAMNYICERIDNPRFYVFTDNPVWVEEQFKEFDYILVKGNPPAGWGSHFDMQLMSCCKHNIISNSTYSWWGAFLNKNPQKIVILPYQWFNPKSCEESTSEKMLCKGWILL